MTRTILLAATASLALGLAACNRSDDTAANDIAAANDMAANDMANDMATPAEAPKPTGDFSAAAAASDMYEIEAGKLAADKGSSQAIKDFGTMLQTDHKKSTEELKAAVAQIPTTMPTPELTADQKDMLDTLKAASGADFDKAFLDQQVQAHGKALDMLNAYAAGGEAEALKQFATKVAPVVQGHLDKAKSLQQ
jgi:putative membrane protein